MKSKKIMKLAAAAIGAVFMAIAFTGGGCSSDDGGNGATYTLTTNVSPANGGSITRNPDQSNYAARDAVLLTANAADGYVFREWVGTPASTGNTAVVSMNGNLTVTAVFEPAGGGENGKNGNGTGGGGIDQLLVNGTGEAWLSYYYRWSDNDDYNWGSQGHIFQSNGVWWSIYKSTEEFTTWYVDTSEKGTWSTNGSELTIFGKGEMNYTISENGDTLTLVEWFDDCEEDCYDEKIYTKTSRIRPIIEGSTPITSDGAKDSRLVNGPDDMWVHCGYGYLGDFESCWGVILKQDGSSLSTERHGNTAWYGEYRLSWHTQGNNKIILEGVYGKYKYSLSNDYLTLIDDGYGGENVYRKRTGLTIIGNTNLNKSPEKSKGIGNKRGFSPKKGFGGSRRR